MKIFPIIFLLIAGVSLYVLNYLDGNKPKKHISKTKDLYHQLISSKKFESYVVQKYGITDSMALNSYIFTVQAGKKTIIWKNFKKDSIFIISPKVVARYLIENPDVFKNGMDPIMHYFIHGKKEGRKWPQ